MYKVEINRMFPPPISGGCTINSGCYGGTKANNGDLLYINLNCGKGQTSMNKKQIIMVIDESGSMTMALPSVKKSLLIALKTLLGLMNEPYDDEILSESVDISIIGFSAKSRIIWQSEKSGTTGDYSAASFSQAVADISAGGPTNLDDALQTAFNLVKSDHATWIILFTDGVPSEGENRTPDDFENMVRSMPYKHNTKIVPLGFTKDFDPDLLSRLGSFTYVHNEQMIAGVFASIMAEIYMCFGVDGVFTVQSPPEGTMHDKFIKEHKPQVIFGKYNVGFIQAEKSFSLGILPFGNIGDTNEAIKEFSGRNVYFDYFDINAEKRQLVRIHISPAIYKDSVDVYDAYFQASTARIMHIIYRRRNSSVFPDIVQEIKRKIADWQHPAANKYKCRIRTVLDCDNQADSMLHAMTEASNTEHQSSYIENAFSTESQQNAMRNAMYDFETLPQQAFPM